MRVLRGVSFFHLTVGVFLFAGSYSPLASAVPFYQIQDPIPYQILFATARGTGQYDQMTYATYFSDGEFTPVHDMTIYGIRPDVYYCNGECSVSIKVTDANGTVVLTEEKKATEAYILQYIEFKVPVYLRGGQTYKVFTEASTTKSVGIYTAGSKNPITGPSGKYHLLHARHNERGPMAFSFYGQCHTCGTTSTCEQILNREQCWDGLGDKVCYWSGEYKKCVSEKPKCKDTDGGIEKGKQGITYGLEGKDDVSQDGHGDYCGIAGNEAGKLKEYFCLDDERVWFELIDCNCKDGACVQDINPPREKNWCYSSRECKAGQICTVDQGECGAYHCTNTSACTDVCTGRCIDKPKKVECSGGYRPGDTFKRDCNTCTCGANGMLNCTKMACNQKPLTCEGGHPIGQSFKAQDGCNTCYCKENGSIFCTEMACNSVCGDAIVQIPEECDDGNKNDFDTCSNTCKKIEVLQCPPCTPPPSSACKGTGPCACGPYVCTEDVGDIEYEDQVVTQHPKGRFSDVHEDSLMGTAAVTLAGKGIIGGYPDGEFKGWKPVNRAEAAKFLMLARFGSVPIADGNGGFWDIKPGEWYVKYVLFAATQGVIAGHPDKSFRPADTVNTAEFLKMLSLAFKVSTGGSYTFVDVDPSAWYAQYAGIASEYNLFPNRGIYLQPSALLTREEVAVALYTFLQAQ